MNRFSGGQKPTNRIHMQFWGIDDLIASSMPVRAPTNHSKRDESATQALKEHFFNLYDIKVPLVVLRDEGDYLTSEEYSFTLLGRAHTPTQLQSDWKELKKEARLAIQADAHNVRIDYNPLFDTHLKLIMYLHEDAHRTTKDEWSDNEHSLSIYACERHTLGVLLTQGENALAPQEAVAVADLQQPAWAGAFTAERHKAAYYRKIYRAMRKSLNKRIQLPPKEQLVYIQTKQPLALGQN